MNIQLTQTFIIALIAGTVASISFSLITKNQAATTGTFDVALIIEEEMFSTHVQKSNDDTIQPRNRAYSHALERAISEISDEYNVVLMAKKAVLSPTADYTDIIRERLKKYYQPVVNK